VRYLSAAAIKHVFLSTSVKENSTCFGKTLSTFTGTKKKNNKNKTANNPLKPKEKARKGQKGKGNWNLPSF